MSIDEFLPTYDATQRRHVVVDADPETTYEAVLHADLTKTGSAVAALSWLRALPARLDAELSGAPAPEPPASLTFADMADSDEWVVLAEEPGEEFVAGAVGRFWQPVIEWRSVTPDEFRAFDEPGYAKLALNLSLRPYGEGRTLVSYEARTAGTDADASRLFDRYWGLIGPFAGLLMSRALSRIKADAEAAAGRAAEVA
ncbi:MAG: hypothetical protein ABEJ31_12750 [Haloarculaceae archaeon]